MVNIGPALAVAIVMLGLLATAVAWVGGTGLQWEIPWSSVRAGLQLVVLALAIGFVADRLDLVAVFVALMAAIAAWTTASRIATAPMTPGEAEKARPKRAGVRQALWCLIPAAALPVVLVIVFVLVGVLPEAGLAIIPVAGILMGNAMAIAGLAGRRIRDELRERHGEVEAAEALGFTARAARLLICRDAAVTAMGPTLDQTKTTGVVTIPGAFVGMVLGGAQPWEAGIMQLFILVGIATVGVFALVLTTQLIALGRI